MANNLPGVSFNGEHCYNDWGMYLASAVKGTPEIQTHMVEIPGRQGLLDMTEYMLGSVPYNNRQLEINLLIKDHYSTWPLKESMLLETLHGKKKEIVFDDDPDWTYVGRCSVEFKPLTKWKEMAVIRADCVPFKQSKTEHAYRKVYTSTTWSIDYFTLNCTASGMYYIRVTTGAATLDDSVKFEGTIYIGDVYAYKIDLKRGEALDLSDLVLPSGNIQISVHSKSSVAGQINVYAYRARL